MKIDVRILSALALVFAAVGAIWFTGLYCSDDTRYLIGAIKIALGEPIAAESLAERRAVLLLPAALAYAATGDAELAIVPYLAFFVLLGVAGYLLARCVLARGAAVLAVLLAAAQPVLFLYAGALLPDVPSAALLALVLVFLFRWLRLCQEGRRAVVEAGAIGAGLAVALTLKESALVLVPVVLAAMLLAPAGSTGTKGRWRDLLVLATGFLVVLVLEAGLMRVLSGHWHSSLVSLASPHDVDAFAEFQGRTVLARVKTLVVELGPHAVVLFAVAGLSTVGVLVEWLRGRLERGEALAWFVLAAAWAWPLLSFTLGTVSTSSWMWPVMQQRYYAPCILPAAILAARMLVWPFRLGVKGPLPVVAAVVLTLAWLASAFHVESGRRGLIYAATAKDAFQLAREDARVEFPGVPVIDVASGWTTDLNRCRALLMPQQLGADRLVETIRTGGDLQGEFGYLTTDQLQPPYLLVGHGDVLGAAPAGSTAEAVARAVGDGALQARRVGQYGTVEQRERKDVELYLVTSSAPE